jgi:hypothetical protein
MDACYVDNELVTPQPGEFYGGWITRDIVEPFKGSPGSWGQIPATHKQTPTHQKSPSPQMQVKGITN